MYLRGSERRITGTSSSRRWLGALLAGALAAVLLPIPPAAMAAVDLTMFSVDSQPASGVGGGRSLVFTPANASIFASALVDGGVRMIASNAEHSFWADITSPTGQSLAVGTYPTSRFATASTAGMDITGDGVGCNTTVGTITIHELSFLSEPEPAVERFAATYENSCDGTSPPYFGELRFASMIDARAATSDPFNMDLGERVVGATTTAAVPFSVTNAGTLDLAMGSVSFSGDDPADFGVTEDLCSHTTLAPGSGCTLGVTFTPISEGIKRAVLHVGDDTARGDRTLVLTGIGFEHPTAVGLRVSASEVRFGGSVRVTAHLRDAEESTSKELSIFAKPAGGTYGLIGTGVVDAAGDLSVNVTMREKTTFVAKFLGDDVFSLTISATRTVNVVPIVTGSMIGEYGRSGAYALYHYTRKCPGDGRGCPTYTTKVVPNHRGKPVCFTVQVYANGAWRTSISCFRLRLNAQSKATASFVYGNRAVIGVRVRVRATFEGDADHTDAASRWSYFKVTP